MVLLKVAASLFLPGCCAAGSLSSLSDEEASPFYEPAIEEYFNLPSDAGALPVQIERVKNISHSDFERRVRRGLPFIIEDAGRDNPLLGATCDQFHKRFPTAQMRAEYTGGSREKFVSLGGTEWFEKDRKKRHSNADELGVDGKVNAPYVWHLKDGGHEAPPKVRAAVQAAWSPPYFLRGAVNIREANESSEFWFVRAPGAVLAHADTYCIPAVSLQLHGSKRWRLMPPPAIPSSSARYDSHDGGIYGTQLWQPTHEALVSEGEALIFFPNQFHETLVEEEAVDTSCAVATTFQFQHPVPVRYIRAYMPTHTMSHLYYEGHCKDLWHSYSTLLPPRGRRPTVNETAIQEEVDGLMEGVDHDKDGGLSQRELHTYLAKQDPRWPRWFLTEDYFYDFRPTAAEKAAMSEEVLANRAKDTLHYLDIDEDEMVSVMELHVALRQWHVLHRRLRDVEGGSKKGKQTKETEAMYKQRFPGGRATAQKKDTRHNAGEL